MDPLRSVKEVFPFPWLYACIYLALIFHFQVLCCDNKLVWGLMSLQLTTGSLRWPGMFEPNYTHYRHENSSLSSSWVEILVKYLIYQISVVSTRSVHQFLNMARNWVQICICLKAEIYGMFLWEFPSHMPKLYKSRLNVSWTVLWPCGHIPIHTIKLF